MIPLDSDLILENKVVSDHVFVIIIYSNQYTSAECKGSIKAMSTRYIIISLFYNLGREIFGEYPRSLATLIYRITRIFDGHFNLAVWRILFASPN